MGQPNSHRQKNRLAPGGRPVHSPTGSLTQAQKQHLLLQQTQQIRKQSQQVSQQLSQQLPQQLQQPASSQLQQQPANVEQAKQKKQNRHKRKLEGAFGEVRNGEQTPDQAHIMAEEDEQGKRGRKLVQKQVSTTQKPEMQKERMQCKAADICNLSRVKHMLCCAVLCCAVLCCAVLCCAVLCRAVPCCAVLCRAVLCCAVLCCAVLCGALRCCAVLCCAVLCCAVLCCAVLCCAVLCCAADACFQTFSACIIKCYHYWQVTTLNACIQAALCIQFNSPLHVHTDLV